MFKCPHVSSGEDLQLWEALSLARTVEGYVLGKGGLQGNSYSSV